MAEAFRLFGVGSLLTVSGASLVIAAFTLRDARRSIKLAEDRMGYLREEQTRLATSLRGESQSLKEELEREREQRLEARREVERLNRECASLRQDRGRSAEELEQERARRLEAERQALREREQVERERTRSLEAERKIAHLEQKLQELQEARREREAQWEREAQRESSPLVREALLKTLPPSRGLSVSVKTVEKPLPTRGTREPATTAPRPEGFSETAAPAKGKKEGKSTRRAVWIPHPDDAEGVRPASARERASSGARNDAPIEMFRKHYDKYLENYQGYVELAEGLYRLREGEASGSLGEREWGERLRRVNDGIKRTSARLDILEGHNPELVTDARISHRAGLAKKHSELQRSMRSRETS